MRSCGRKTWLCREPRGADSAHGASRLKDRLAKLGYALTQEELDQTYQRFLAVADKKQEVFDEDWPPLSMMRFIRSRTGSRPGVHAYLQRYVRRSPRQPSGPRQG